MIGFTRILAATCVALGLALAGGTAMAQQAAPKQGATPPPSLKQGTPAAIAAAKEILTLKNAAAMYGNAVFGIVEQTRNTLVQSNLNYQKDLSEVAAIVAKNLAGREKEIGDGMAQVYANEFSEQELKDLVTFYKSPLGQKLLTAEPRAVQLSMSYMQQWAAHFGGTVNGMFRAEMKKRGKEI